MMFTLICVVASVMTAINADIYDTERGEETGEVFAWSNAEYGFNDFETTRGSLDDLECYMENIYYGRCQNDLTRSINGAGNKAPENAYIIAYFVDEVYSHDDLFIIKQDFGVTDYSFVEIMGLSLDSASQFYHRLNQMLKQSRYHLYPSDYDEFKDGFKYNTQLTMIEVDTVENALSLAKQVSKYAEKKRPDDNLVSIIAPSKAAVDEVTLRRNLLSVTYNYTACNTSDGDYCLDYWCNRTSWDAAAYSDSCVNQFDLFGFMLAVFLFIPMCCIGCCCMDGIQTPLRYPSRVLPVRKEF